MLLPLVVVDDLNVVRVPTRPPEANPPLVVYPNAVLPCTPAFEPLEPVPRRNSQVFYSLGRIQDEKFPKGLTLNLFAPLCNSNSIEDTGSFGTRKRSNHDPPIIP
jgi:hypothetical protein